MCVNPGRDVPVERRTIRLELAIVGEAGIGLEGLVSAAERLEVLLRRRLRDHDIALTLDDERRRVERLVAGPGVWICAECVTLATEIIAEAGDARTAP